jgi:hypothetical protein
MKKTLSIILGLIVLPSLALAAFETTVFQPQQIYSGVNATSTLATTYTATSSDVVGYSTILLTPNVGTLTMTLPASTTYTLSSWLPQAGLRLTMFVFNATTTAGQNIIIAGNTANGSILENASTSATITPQKGAILEVMRKPNSDLLWTLIPTI